MVNQKQLGIQRKIIDELLEDKVIDLKENVDIKKYKIKRNLELSIDYQKIKEITKS